MTRSLSLLAVLGLSNPARAAYPPIYQAETLREGSAIGVLATGTDRVLSWLGGQTIGEWSVEHGWRERVLDLPVESEFGYIYSSAGCLIDDGSLVLSAHAESDSRFFFLEDFEAEPTPTTDGWSSLVSCARGERAWIVNVSSTGTSLLYQDENGSSSSSISPRAMAEGGRFVLDGGSGGALTYRLSAYVGGVFYDMLNLTDDAGDAIPVLLAAAYLDGSVVARELGDHERSPVWWDPATAAVGRFLAPEGSWVVPARQGPHGEVILLEIGPSGNDLQRWWPAAGLVSSVALPGWTLHLSAAISAADRDDILLSRYDVSGGTLVRRSWRWASDLGLVELPGGESSLGMLLGSDGITFGGGYAAGYFVRGWGPTGEYRDIGDKMHSFIFEASDGSVLSRSFQGFHNAVHRWTRLCDDPDGDNVCGSDVCTDDDADGICDEDDLCFGQDDAGDADGDAVCDDLDLCWGDDLSGDDDGGGLCGNIDPCWGDNELGDGDGDGVCGGEPCTDSDLDGSCDEDDLCVGDDTTGDLDLDGVCDDLDLCAGDDATGDADGDGICEDQDGCWGDDHRGDSDRDGVCDDVDACYGDDAAGDADGDGICDDADLCQGDNALGDGDGDGVCGVEPCEDTDGDGLCDEADPCPLDLENDADGDGICEAADNCANDANADQLDSDGDGRGDACEPDSDGDGVIDDLDNCPFDGNPTQADRDGNGRGDACDADSDSDGVSDDRDACLGTPAGSPVGADGCSVDQACPCDNPWKNKGAYQSCVAHKTNELVGLGVITGSQKGAIVSAAARSSCGKR